MNKEKIELNEVLDYNGFYYVPNEYPLAVNREGDLLNSYTGNVLKTTISKYGYRIINVTYKNNDKTHRLNRLVARTFIGRPEHLWNIDFNELHVNHIDGNKLNNNASNLEWCTPKENQLHALETGLRNLKQVLAKDLRNNSIKEFTDSYTCARAFGMLGETLRQHLNSDKFGTKVKNYHVFKFNDGKPWPILDNIDLSKNYDDFNQRGYWIATDNDTGKKYYNRTLKELCEKLNLKFVTISHHQRKNIYDFENWTINYHSRSDKDTDKLIGVRAPTNNGGVKLKLINTLTNEETVFDSKLSMEKLTNIPIGTISYYLNTDRLLNDKFKIISI